MDNDENEKDARMTVLSAQTIRRLNLVSPMEERQQHPESGCSFGLSAAGYDIRLDQDIVVTAGCFILASSMEKFHMPNDISGEPKDKSTWARRGLAVQNTVIEPGWTGFLTLEISCHLYDPFSFIDLWDDLKDEDKFFKEGILQATLRRGTPIAQVVFEYLDQETEQPYSGKYQNQERGPVKAKDGTGHG